ncbi:oligosaccharide flippase family protein [Providencia sp. wls1914]|uniref:oligosaccharide flippase family protein n=1 Tax=Providencia sp. wls1914 TaxID=2675156 RepID=UPI0012B65C28|nr:oligosaccharide flippase family protein [Providencia sp. wls1914]MTC70890.1 oligosaccharide flippase family protein [Providencia sp. wls1914]
MKTIISEINKNLAIIKNAFWLISEKVISIFGLIFITSYVAVYIGPDNFGKLSFAISIFIIVQTISMLGTDTILFKRISKNSNSGIKLMLSTTKIRWTIYSLISACYLTYCIYFTKDPITITFTIAVSISYLFLTIDHYSIYFNATLNSKVNVLFNVIGLSISLLARYFIVLYQFDIVYLSIPIITTTLIPYTLRFILFNKRIKKPKLNKKTNVYPAYLIKSGGAIALSNVSIAIYSKISQIFIAILVSNHALGIFTVAFTLAYAWLFLPQAIITSYFSKIYSLKREREILIETSKLNLFTLVLCVSYVIFIYYFGEHIILNLYGKEYSEASHLLIYLSIASTFSCLGIISYRYIVASSGYNYLSKKMILTSIIGIIISYFLILHLKIPGAIIAIFVIEIFSLTILNYFYKKQSVLRMHFNTILIPFKMTKKIKCKKII